MTEIDEKYLEEQNNIIKMYIRNKNIIAGLNNLVISKLVDNYVCIDDFFLNNSYREYNENKIFDDGKRLDKTYLTYSHILTIYSLISELVSLGVKASDANAFLLLKCEYIGDVNNVMEEININMMKRLK